MTEVPKSAGESALRFSTAGEAIAYVGKHNLSRVEADPIFDANEIDRDDAWAMVEKARAAEAKSRELGKHGRQLTEPGAQSFGGHTIGRVQATPSKAAPDPEPEAAPTVTELFHREEQRRAEQKRVVNRLLEEAVEGEKIFSSPTQPQVEPEATPTPGSVILSKAAPMDAAIQFAKDLLRVEGTLATYYFHGDWWQWNGRFYEMAPAERIGGMVYIYLQGAKIGTSDDNQRYRPRPENAEALLKCLKVCVAIDDRDVPPLWLDGRSGSADGLLVFRNCLVDAATGEVFALTPQLWAQGGVDFDFAPDAAAPRWEQFLEEVFPGDRESQDTVEEQLGYGMTNDTRFEKGALWVGVKRSGKSTLLWLQEQLVGAGAYTSLSFHDWMKTENSRSHMIGKKIGVFPDVRLKPAKAFGTVGYDPGGIDHQSAQLLLQIIGRDTVSLGRKFKEAWLGRLMIKFIITTNEVPNLSDAGGALSARFIMLEFKQSFFGREDITLRDKLRAELPGIANRCLAAYRRLCARGRFIQPKAGLELAQKIEAKGNAYAAFMNDCFVEDPGGEGVLCGAFFAAFQSWCRDARRLDLLTETPQTLIKKCERGRALATPQERSWRPRRRSEATAPLPRHLATEEGGR